MSRRRHPVAAVVVAVLSAAPALAAAAQSGIPITMTNNCPTGTTLYTLGDSPSGPELPNSGASIAPGGTWQSTLPGSWTSGRLWVCPSATAGKDPYGPVDGQFFTYSCTWVEMTVGTDGTGVQFVNINPTYIHGIWMPVLIEQSGGSCSGLCASTCSTKPSMSTVAAKCPTEMNGPNSGICLGVSYVCDPGLGGGDAPECLADWFAKQLAIAQQNGYFAGEALLPTAFQIYGCGNNYPYLTDGEGQKVCAALNRGVVGGDWTDASGFYPAGVNANLYSAWIHDTLGCEAYAFSYDDTSVEQGGDMTYRNDTGNLSVSVTWCPWG